MFWGISREKSQYDGEKSMAPSNYDIMKNSPTLTLGINQT